ncbi:MAG: aspartyl protease family protein [Bacteroidia bacterium]
MEEKKIINPSFKNWTNNNRELLRKYKGKWIGYTKNGIIASDVSFLKMTRMAEKQTDDYISYFVSPDMDEFRFRPIRIQSLKTHEWPPEYDVIVKLNNKKLKLKMLVDSGADISLLPLHTGLKLGFRHSPGEAILSASGIGGAISYILRNIEFIIDTHSFLAPVAWVQDNNCTDLILGREKVFDLFDITFKQADEEIIFKWRGK